MRRVIDTLNEMSFELPNGYEVTSDKYDLVNGQGFINKENYLSKDGKVISLFELHRDPDQFFDSYQELVEKYKTLTDKFELAGQFNLRIGEFIFPCYVIKGYHDKLIYTLQVFINCGDCLGCLMAMMGSYTSDVKKLLKTEPIFADIVKILRTVQ